jgi:sugar lactone lactonase YvrE
VDQATVVRLTLTEGGASAPQVTAESTVVTGLPERADASAFVKGPTGLALSSSGTLYVANNLADSIDSVPSALTATSPDSVGTTVTSGGQLQGPLGLTIAPDGDLLVANADNGKVVEVTPSGAQVGEFYADHNVGQDPPGNGDLFDLAVDQAGTGVYFVGDDNNDLLLLH